MQTKIFKKITIIIATVILIAAFYSLIQDIIYFISKKETTATILSIENAGVQKPYHVTLSYYNDYLEKKIRCVVNLDKSDGNLLISTNNKATPISYGRYFPKSIYLSNYTTPRMGLILVDLVLIGFMLIIIWPLKKNRSKPIPGSTVSA